MNTGQHKAILEGRRGDIVRSVSFSSDGSILVSGGDDGTIKLWDVNTGQLKTTLRLGSSVHSVSFSPDGSILASGGNDNTVKLWDMNTGQLKATLRHESSVRSVSFSPDGSILASGSDDNTVQLWDVNTGQLKTTLKGHASSVSSVSFSPDGSILASGSDDKTIMLWNVSPAPTPYPGDFDGDLNVNFSDFLAFVGVFGLSSSEANYDAEIWAIGRQRTGRFKVLPMSIFFSWVAISRGMGRSTTLSMKLPNANSMPCRIRIMRFPAIWIRVTSIRIKMVLPGAKISV